MPDYEKLIAECIAEMDKPLPKPCLSTKECRMAGGCPDCYAGLLTRRFQREAIEEYFDRQEDHRVFGTPLPKIN